jgi:2-polyprenyl-3-methyl-5-hydroxy-6-metoxy-1,4-benzoquinol methylase
MTHDEQYIDINKTLWNERTGHHLGSAFYDMESFISGRSSLNDIELDIIGDVNGKSILHLQCHFGQDTLSLARMGAKVTGVDFSEAAIDKANELSNQLGLDAAFICSDVYKLYEKLDRQFDMVFTTYGVLGWLPDMKRWANVVSKFLKPGGKLILVEFHPAVWMFDNAFTYVQYSYFNKETIIENEEGTYADKKAPMQLGSVNWNHDLSEVLQNIIDTGLTIEAFHEYDYSPYNAFSKTVEFAPGKYHIHGMEEKLPLVYAVMAVKK